MHRREPEGGSDINSRCGAMRSAGAGWTWFCVWIGFFFFQAEDGIRDYKVTGVQTCALPISVNVPPRSIQNCQRLSWGVERSCMVSEPVCLEVEVRKTVAWSTARRRCPPLASNLKVPLDRVHREVFAPSVHEN